MVGRNDPPYIPAPYLLLCPPASPATPPRHRTGLPDSPPSGTLLNTGGAPRAQGALSGPAPPGSPPAAAQAGRTP